MRGISGRNSFRGGGGGGGGNVKPRKKSNFLKNGKNGNFGQNPEFF